MKNSNGILYDDRNFFILFNFFKFVNDLFIIIKNEIMQNEIVQKMMNEFYRQLANTIIIYPDLKRTEDFIINWDPNSQKYTLLISDINAKSKEGIEEVTDRFKKIFGYY